MPKLFICAWLFIALIGSSCAQTQTLAAKSQLSPDKAGPSHHASNVYRVRMFFGLSLPSGGGVSLKQWQQFQSQHIATSFAGFNVVDSTGYYLGQPERSKVVTIVICAQEMAKVRELAAEYASQFHQDSVMLVQVPVASWEFVGPDGQVQQQQC